MAAAAETGPVAKQIQYVNLGSVRDVALAQRALDLALTDAAPVPLRPGIIRAVAGQHPAMAFDWAVAHEAQIQTLLESTTRNSFIVGLAQGSGDVAVAQRVKAYAARAIPEGSRKPADTAVGVIEYRAALRARQAAALAKWAGS